MRFRLAVLFRRPLMAAAVAGGLPTTLLAAGSGPASAAGGNDWPGFLFDNGHSSYNAAATSITPSSVANLQHMWTWATPASPNSGTNALL